MKTTAILFVTAMLLFAGLSSAQVLTRENPFPEQGTPSQVFDTSKSISLTGTIAQEISRSSDLSYLFLRVLVDGTTWTVQLKGPKLFCDLCLIDDYTPEMARVKVGTTVTLKGYETKQHDRRLLLIPTSGPATIAGMVLAGGNGRN